MSQQNENGKDISKQTAKICSAIAGFNADDVPHRGWVVSHCEPGLKRTIGSQQKQRGARLLDPADLVNLFFNL